MSESFERYLIKYESARNKAIKEWFDARPHYRRDRDNEFLFEGGFRMAYELLSATNEVRDE